MPEEVIFKNSNRKKLNGLLSSQSELAGSADQGKNPIVVMAHGFRSSKHSTSMTFLEKLLNDRGLDTFRFDFYGHGESAGEFPEITISEAVDDLTRAIKTVRELGYDKVGLYGSSFGGQIALLVAAQDPELSVLALKSPVSDFFEKLKNTLTPRELEQWQADNFFELVSTSGEYPLKYDFYKDAESQGVYPIADRITLPTLIVHGDQDRAVPIDQSLRLSELLSDCHLEVVPGADHGYAKTKDFKFVLKALRDFLVEELINKK